MNRRYSWIALLLIAVVFAGGLGWLFKLRLGQGDLFPAYSTLRADPLGTRAIFEALQELPGLRVERSVQPMKKIAETPARTLVFAGMERNPWEAFSMEEANVLDAAVRAGSRAVIVFKAERLTTADVVEPFVKGKETDKKTGEKKADEKKDQEEKKSSKEERQSPRNDEAEKPVHRTELVDWSKRWGLELRTRWIMDREAGALRKAGAPETLAAQVPWKSDLYFHLTQGSDWRVLYTRGNSPVLMEMTLGRGTVVVATDTFFLSNEAMQKSRETSLLAWLVGGNTRVVFNESHLGVEEDVGIAKLARRYGLAGAFFVLLLLTALFVWQRMTLFVPPAPETAETALTYHPSAGLEALLRRALPPGKLVETCVAEWTRTSRAGDVEKVRAAVAAQSGKASPAETYNAIVRALKRR
ncbi:DUF4350 domain-containing protein [Nibricoccus aquaticus]|uniref:DUF4350 domain-containing protein n=1 Tax=Nibricoccus aquaticus TaxID=2576891 RepID=UPI001FE7ED81|nr:DUF4350 domain-containing protein [Nibricoccus aquaticus]